MAFDAFCYLKGSGVSGETQDQSFSKEGAFEILSFEIGAENTINIGSISSGGGAGKATFKPLTMRKKTDSASCALFAKLCEGKHFDDMVIELRRSGSQAGSSGATFLKWEFKLVMLADISWSGSDGDDVCEENLIWEYGAMKVTYSMQDIRGKKTKDYSGEWSRVRNQANLAV